jgi:hypothetical protein
MVCPTGKVYNLPASGGNLPGPRFAGLELTSPLGPRANFVELTASAAIKFEFIHDDNNVCRLRQSNTINLVEIISSTGTTPVTQNGY